MILLDFSFCAELPILPCLPEGKIGSSTQKKLEAKALNQNDDDPVASGKAEIIEWEIYFWVHHFGLCNIQ